MLKNRSVWVVIAAVVGLVIAIFSLVRGCSPGSSLEEAPFHGLTAAVARETAALLGGQGGEVVLIPEDRERLNAALREAMARYPEIRMATAELPPSVMPGIASFSADSLGQIVHSHPEADAFVSLRELPPVSLRELQSSSGRSPRWVVVYGSRMDWAADDLPFDLVIMPRPSSDRPEGKAKTEQEWFERYYTVLRKP